jgi:hypothetical protein
MSVRDNLKLNGNLSLACFQKARAEFLKIEGDITFLGRFFFMIPEYIDQRWTIQVSLLNFPQLSGGGASATVAYRLSLPPRHSVEHPCRYREISNTGCEIYQIEWIDY